MSELKWVTEPDEYVCTLSHELQEIAETELREDPSGRKEAMECLREWIRTNPKILNSRLDGNFLLRFLRFKKFSVLQAQEAMQRYLLLRQSFGIAFNNFDMRIPMMQDLTDLGYMFVSPRRDSKGRRVIIYRPGVFDLEKFTNADMCRIHGIVYETLLENEEDQIRGFVHFADGKGVGFPYLTLFTIKEAVRIVKNGERTLPMRHKEVHVINAHVSMKFAIDFGMSLISDKIKKRFRFYTSKEDMLKTAAIERSVLPKEYGGDIPMADMIAVWKEELQQRQPMLLTHDNMAVDESLFSEQARIGAVSALKRPAATCGSEDDFLFGVTGNFRKLQVD